MMSSDVQLMRAIALSMGQQMDSTLAGSSSESSEATVSVIK
jgi:hypothetical protein